MKNVLMEYLPRPGLWMAVLSGASVPFMMFSDWAGITACVLLGTLLTLTSLDGGTRRDCGVALIYVALAMSLLRSFAYRIDYVESVSMYPTIIRGDRFVSTLLEYGVPNPFDQTSTLIRTGDPKRFDIVLFLHPKTGERYVKRVVGMPGETVRAKGRNVYVNGKKLNDPYGSYEVDLPVRGCGDVKLGPDEYFVMGDNRNNSYDSRDWGPVRRDLIYARSRFIYASSDMEKMRTRKFF